MRLKAEHISYKYLGGSREVLSDVSLELGSTDRLGIAAPSGFGKTTLCQILAGYRTPTAGRYAASGERLLPGADDLAASGAGGQSARADADGSAGGRFDQRTCDRGTRD